jgi:hypothetical protein
MYKKLIGVGVVLLLVVSFLSLTDTATAQTGTTTVVCPAGFECTNLDPQVTFVSSQIEIQSSGRLIGTVKFRVRAAGGDLYVYRQQTPAVWLEESRGTTYHVSSQKDVVSTVSSLWNETDDADAAMWKIEDGREAEFTYNTGVDSYQLFAGAYAAQLKSIRVNKSLSSADAIYLNLGDELRTGSKVVIGEVSPYITSVSSPVSPKGIVTIQGERMDVTTSVYLDGQLVTNVSGKDSGTVISFPLPAGTTPGYHTVYVENGKGKSNTLSFTVNAFDATVTFPTAPTLSLVYNLLGRESQLRGLFDIIIDGGQLGVRVTTSYGASALLYSETGQQVSSPGTITVVSGGRSGIAPDGNKYVDIAPGTKARMRIVTSSNPQQMFAGTYRASLQTLLVSAYGSSTLSTSKLEIPKNTTNAKTIIGELTPYIESVVPNSNIVPGTNVKVYGKRFINARVKIDGVLQTGINLLVNDTGTALRFTMPKTVANGGHTLSLTKPTGESNNVWISVGTTTSTGGCINLTVNLAVGSSGPDVVALQNWLISQGFAVTGDKGYFGAGTKAAVMAFQAAKGIPESGFVGPLTRAAINSSTCTKEPVVVCPVGYICTPGTSTEPQPVNCPAGYTCTIVTSHTAPVVSLVSMTTQVSDSSDSKISDIGTFVIKFKVQAPDEDIFIGASASSLLNGTSGVEWDTIGFKGVSSSNLTSTANAVTGQDSSGRVFVVKAGTSQTFTLTVVLNNTSGVTGFYDVDVKKVNYGYSAVNSKAGAVTFKEFTTDQVPLKGYGPVVTNTVKVTSPNGGEYFNSGDSVNIKWSTGVTPYDTARIELLYQHTDPTYAAGTTFLDTIALKVPNTGSYTWKIPEYYGTGVVVNSFRVRVSVGDWTDYSDNSFTIKQGVNNIGVKVYKPAAGITAIKGQGTTISWAASGDQYMISLLRLNDPSFLRISLNPTRISSGVYTWTVPTDLKDGSDYYIRITEGNRERTGYSGIFKITSMTPSPTPTVSPSVSPTPSPTDTTGPVISSVRVGSITTSSAIVTWSTNEQARGTIEFKPVGYSYWGARSTSDLKTAHSFSLSSLQSNTKYEYRITVKDTAGNSTVSTAGTFYTTAPATTPTASPTPTYSSTPSPSPTYSASPSPSPTYSSSPTSSPEPSYSSEPSPEPSSSPVTLIPKQNAALWDAFMSFFGY